MGKKPLLVIGAGGTGGHMFPAQSLAEVMLERGWRVRLMTDARGARYAGGFPAAVERVVLAAASPGRGGMLARLVAPLRIAAGIWGAMRAFRVDRPAVVAGFGGYPALPSLAAGWFLGVPRLIHEQNAVLGRVNRLFARRVGVVACGLWPVSGLPVDARAMHTGNPVRAAVLAARMPYDPASPRLAAFGGSQGSEALAEGLVAALALLPADLRRGLQLSLQAPEAMVARLQARLAELQISAEVAPFFADAPARMAAAALVLGRAGASTVAELAVLGRPAILVPYPHATADHQTANAASLAAAGGAICMAQDDFLNTAATAALLHELLTHPDRRAQMAAAALTQAKPQATLALADQIEQWGAGS